MLFGLVRLAAFSGSVEIFFGQRWLTGSAPRKNWPVRLRHQVVEVRRRWCQN